jgi:hypothetical protein
MTDIDVRYSAFASGTISHTAVLSHSECLQSAMKHLQQGTVSDLLGSPVRGLHMMQLLVQ